MDMDLSQLVVSATKPKGRPARMLAEAGMLILPVEEDEGNVDRYILSKRLVIERRTGSGFLQGIMDKTLFTSAIYLREHFDLPVLMVEGQVNFEYARFDPQAVRGALSSMMLQYGMTVLSTPDIEETVNLVAMMTRQEQVGIPEISFAPKRKAVDLPDMQRRIVEMLPGCGMVMARALLQRFGSVRRIANATGPEFRSMRGIGAKKAEEMVRVLNADYESVDTERDLEDAIEAAPELMFSQPVDLVARQHVLFSDDEARHVIDLVFLDRRAGELILVELKRGKLDVEHERQLRRYLNEACRSDLLNAHLAQGAKLRGVLATVAPCEYESEGRDVSAYIVDRGRAIAALKALRDRRNAVQSLERRV